ncbi:MAG: hypothetical protein ABI761_04410 [Saprospiraceae bacterium]
MKNKIQQGMADYYNKERLDYRIWNTILDILKDENLVLKNSLITIFQSPLNPDELEQAEQLQSRLVNMDDSLLWLNKKVRHYFLKLNLVPPNLPGMKLQSQRRQKKLQIILEELKQSFLLLKSDVEKFKQSLKSS